MVIALLLHIKKPILLPRKRKKNKLLELVNEIIHRKQRELELLKALLLEMHKPRLIANKLDGKTRTISIQSSPPTIAH